MIYRIFALIFISIFTHTNTSNSQFTSSNKVQRFAHTFHKNKTTCVEKFSMIEENSTTVPSLESFELAYEGYNNLKSQNKIQNNLLTIIDFSLSSKSKRMWVIDMDSNNVLFHSLVSHGMNSGEEYATQFSNKSESFKSSLGFFLTAECYVGKHGNSLRLDGVEKTINDNARDRAIVIHGADYVSETFIKQNGRLGRSQGCPALPNDLKDAIISKIKNKSVLYIYHPSRKELLKNELFS